MNDRVVRGPTASMHARRSPGGIIGLWAWDTAVALLASTPAVAVARAAYGAAPDGDALLWKAGALPLLALVTREASAVRAAVAAAASVLVLGAVVGIIPLAAFLLSISNRTAAGRRLGLAQAIGGAIRIFRPLVIVWLAITLAQGFVLGVAFVLGDLTQAWSHGWLGEAGSQKLGIVVGATLLPGAVALGVLQDVSRAAVARFALGWVEGLLAGGRALRSAPFAVASAWGWRFLAASAAVVAASLLAGRIGGRGGWTLVALAAAHQAVILSRVALRASWMAEALRIVDATIGVARASDQPEPSER